MLMKSLSLIAAMAAVSVAAGAAADTVPQVLAPGVISGPANDAGPTFTPDGKTVYFFRSNGSDYFIMESQLSKQGWSSPAIAPFSGQWRDLEPAMAPDGSYLIFASTRPVPGSSTPPDGSWGGQPHPGKGGNLWRVDRKGEGWGEPQRLPDTVNRSFNVFSPTIAANGDLYFMEASGEGLHFRLFMSALKDGKYQPPVALPFTAGQYGGVDAAVAADESYLVFSSNRPPAPAGQSGMFIVFRKDGVWGEPQVLPDAINSFANANESHLSPDGKTLYFASGQVAGGPGARDAAAARKALADMQSWNDGDLNIWQVDLTDYLKGQQK
jgi:Tol biopolymer transport system component